MRSALERVSLNPQQFPEGHLIVGRYYLSIGRMPEALEQFQTGPKQNPTHAAAYQKGIAAAQRGLGRFDEALGTINAVLARDAGDPKHRPERRAFCCRSGMSTRR
jgi:tetratricopeptide (TPR) repeat protein